VRFWPSGAREKGSVGVGGQISADDRNLFELSEPKVQRREQALTRAGFAPLQELRRQRQEFETRSQFVLDVLE